VGAGLAARPVWAEIDHDAIAHNVGVLRGLAGSSRFCAVVKANAYGHGAVEVARTALAAGADWLGVALVAEAAQLREAGIDVPILLLSQPPPDDHDAVVALEVRPAVYTVAGIEGLAAAVARAGVPSLPVHLKIDTGMHRVGAAPADAVPLARAVSARPELVLEGVWTHCAVADEPANAFTAEQEARFDTALAQLRAAGVEPPLVHAANSAATIAHPGLRRDLVRCGIALYGLPPSPALDGAAPLRPALSLHARVSHVHEVEAGEAVSYGQRHRFDRDHVVAVLPLGYADGVPRRLSAVGGAVLLGGRRLPMVGTVTMDQLLVDCGPAGDPATVVPRPGDEAVLIGAQGGERIRALDWAMALDTINYEIVCGIGPRVSRRHRHPGPAGAGGRP
jgi:alanine racemase